MSIGKPTKTALKHPTGPTKTSFSPLTLPRIPAIIADAGFSSGEMAEWLKALVLKTSDVERHRGFESLSLRQQNIIFGMEKYPRGRRGSPAKGVGCDKRRPGSNPGFSANTLVPGSKSWVLIFVPASPPPPETQAFRGLFMPFEPPRWPKKFPEVMESTGLLTNRLRALLKCK